VRADVALKRTFDVVVSAVLLVLLAVPLGIAAAAVRLTLGAPVLFRQVRPGRDETPFTILKLRTMRTAYDDRGEPLPDVERVSRLGRWLRATSIDELPELWNVLRGDMSLVGPRPLLTAYLGRYSAEQRRRHELRPGVTGWAQVKGRNALTWEEKFALDVWYVDHRSFLLDLRILALTPVAVLRSRGINASDDETMPTFTGSPSEELPGG
jgi:lipopolysaccharide/colanic/teichoic acid biosynthesis glycosyltransferase